jgi:hypothetical protein
MQAFDGQRLHRQRDKLITMSLGAAARWPCGAAALFTGKPAGCPALAPALACHQ